MKIRVEERHIAAGARCSSTRCPIALALAEQLNLAWTPCVTQSTAAAFEVGTDTQHLASLLPPEATDFIRRFDRGERVGPVEFELDVVYLRPEGTP